MSGQNQTVQLRIINDNIPEVDEDIYIYLSEPTGGAVLANPSSGGQSWAVVKVAGNDLLNGRIYFEISSLTLDEDKKPTGIILKIMCTVRLSLNTVIMECLLFNTYNARESHVISITISFSSLCLNYVKKCFHSFSGSSDTIIPAYSSL